MRRSASEIINDLEQRIAHLEKQSAKDFEQEVEIITIYPDKFVIYVNEKYAKPLDYIYKKSRNYEGLYYRILGSNTTIEMIRPVLALADALAPSKDFSQLTQKLSNSSKMSILHNLGVNGNAFPNGTRLAKNLELMVWDGKLNESDL